MHEETNNTRRKIEESANTPLPGNNDTTCYAPMKIGMYEENGDICHIDEESKTRPLPRGNGSRSASMKVGMHEETNNTRRIIEESSNTPRIIPSDNGTHSASMKGGDDYVKSDSRYIDVEHNNSTDVNSSCQNDQSRLSWDKPSFLTRLQGLFRWMGKHKKTSFQNKECRSHSILLTVKEPDKDAYSLCLSSSDKTNWLIGREFSCDIRLSASLVHISRRHATLKVENGTWKLVVHGGNGVKIDNMRIEDHEFIFDFHKSSSYVIQLGDMDNLFSDDVCTIILWMPDNDVMSGQASQSEYSAPLSDTQERMKRLKVLEEQVLKQICSELHVTAKYGAIQVTDYEKLKHVKQKLRSVLKRRVNEISHLFSVNDDWCKDQLLIKIEDAIFNDIMRLGPITPLLDDESVEEIMVNGHDMIFIRRHGVIEVEKVQWCWFYDDEHVLAVIQRIVEKAGQIINEDTPRVVVVQMEDGSYATIVLPPLAIDGPTLTIRKFKNYVMTAQDMIRYETMSEEMAALLENAVKLRQNILVSGGPRSGKTTLLNVLGESIPQNERLVIIEDSAKLRLPHVNKIRLKTCPAYEEDKRLPSNVDDLFTNVVPHLCPDRIILGECNDSSTWGMLQMMGGGYAGSMMTICAKSPRDVLERVENMLLLRESRLPVSNIRHQIASAIDLIIQLNRLPDGSRKIVEITEITGMQGDTIVIQPLFYFTETGTDANGHVNGDFRASGCLPRFMEYGKCHGNIRKKHIK